MLTPREIGRQIGKELLTMRQQRDAAVAKLNEAPRVSIVIDAAQIADVIRAGQSDVKDGLAELVQALTAPKQLVIDETGRPIGVESK